jgi:hypothetical protein
MKRIGFSPLALRPSRLLIAAIVAIGFASVTLIGQSPAPTATKMAAAAKAYLATLTPEQKAKGSFPFDSKNRLVWFFTPQQDKEKKATRIGLPLSEQTAEQKAAALALLKTGLSEKGFEQASTIMSLEGVLLDLEKNGAMVRNPGWYFVSVYGDPSNTSDWSWRFEGHHMSVNYTLGKGEVVSATPLMFGANPADIKDGPRKGLRTLPGIENLARELISSLTPEQDKVAKQAKDFAEIQENKTRAGVDGPVGVTMAQMNDVQKKTLSSLLKEYTDRMPADLAAVEAKRAASADPAKLYFGYSGSIVPGKPYTYRIQGPTFVVEFLNIQADSAKNPANHIHSAWRVLPADFGLAQ